MLQEAIGSVGDSDFLFVPCSRHVDHIISHIKAKCTGSLNKYLEGLSYVSSKYPYLLTTVERFDLIRRKKTRKVFTRR